MFGRVLVSVAVTVLSSPVWAAGQCSGIFTLAQSLTTLFPVTPLDLNVDVHRVLNDKLAQHLLKITSQRELMAETADRLFGIEKSVALKTGKEQAPEIRRETFELLLKVYGTNSQLARRERLDLAKAVEEALRADPYFIWLSEKAKSQQPSTTIGFGASGALAVIASKDPVQHLLSSLNGESPLPLTLALWRLRREMDPSLHVGTRTVVESLLQLHRLELAATQLLLDFQKVLPPNPQSYVWNYAKNSEQAERSRAELLRQIRDAVGSQLTVRQYELSNELQPYEVILLRRFFEPAEGARLENLLHGLNTIIEATQKVDDASVFR